MGEGKRAARTAIKAILLGTSVAAAVMGMILTVGIVYLFYGMSREAASRDFADFISSSVTRAIIKEELGYIVYPMDQRASGYDSVPTDILDTRNFIRSLRDTGRSIDCDLPIKIIPRDVRYFYPTFSVMTSEWPRIYYVFFGFEIPDIRPFFDSEPDSPLLAAAPIFPETEVKRNDSGTPINGWEIGGLKRRFDQRFGKSTEWRSTKCETYSYIEFLEK